MYMNKCQSKRLKLIILVFLIELEKYILTKVIENTKKTSNTKLPFIGI